MGDFFFSISFRNRTKTRAKLSKRCKKITNMIVIFLFLFFFLNVYCRHATMIDLNIALTKEIMES